MGASRFSVEEVARYYDRSTPAFVALGQGGSEGAIRRAVWGSGARDRRDAFHYVDDRVAEIVRGLGPTGGAPHVVDLGCGVGASLCYLAAALPIRGTGVTLSALQAELAARRAREAGLADRIAFVQGDYSRLPPIAAADVAFAIESFVHAPSAASFFAQCRALVRPGGMLVICDDFKRPAADARAAAATERFCRGWHINSLVTADELRSLASAAGFEHAATADLSAYLELHRPRDRAVSVLLGLFGWLPLHRTPFGHLVGGTALQECLTRGWIGYDLVTFRRVADGGGSPGHGGGSPWHGGGDAAPGGGSTAPDGSAEQCRSLS